MTILSSKISKDHGLVAIAHNGQAFEILKIDLKADIVEQLYYTDEASEADYRGIRRAFRSL